MTLSHEADADESHPFWYGRMIGILHVNICHRRPRPFLPEILFLHVWWFGCNQAHDIELPNEEDYNQDRDSNEQAIQEGELEDYDYAKDDEEDLYDDEDMLEEVDGDELGPEDGEDYDEMDAEYDYDD